MICIRYAPDEGCDVSGSAAELQAIADAIYTLSHSGRDSIAFAADPSQSPAPYPFVLSALEVRVGSGPVCASVQDRVLSVVAASEYLPAFASFFEFEPTASEGDHSHHEHFPGNDYISSESMPLVISIHHPHPVA